MKYYLYCRKSSTSDDRQTLSIESQVDALTEVAEKRNLEVVRIFRESQSAKEPGRRFFREMMDAIEAKGILCWKLDRLARNPVDAGRVQWCLQSSILKKIVTPEREYNPEDNSLLQAVEYGMANQFILDLRKNVNRGIETKLKLGQYPDRPPIGYMNDPITRKIVIDPHKFPLVRQFFEKVLSKSCSGEQLFDLADKLGLRRRHKGQLVTRPLSRSQIYEFLKNPFYTGKFRWKGELYQGEHEPMLTDLEHEEIIKMFNRKRIGRSYVDASQSVVTLVPTTPRPKNRHKLSGLIRCRDCGKLVIPWRIKNRQQNGRKYLYFVCSSRFNRVYRKSCCQPAIRAEKLEALVRAELERIALSQEMADWMFEQAEVTERQERTKQEEVIASIETQIKSLETRRAKLFDFVLDCNLEPEDFKTKRQEIDGQIGKLRSRLSDEQEKLNAIAGSLTKAIDVSRSLLNLYDQGTDEEVRQAITTVVSSIKYVEERVEMEARRPWENYKI